MSRFFNLALIFSFQINSINCWKVSSFHFLFQSLQKNGCSVSDCKNDNEKYVKVTLSATHLQHKIHFEKLLATSNIALKMSHMTFSPTLLNQATKFPWPKAEGFWSYTLTALAKWMIRSYLSSIWQKGRHFTDNSRESGKNEKDK